MKIIHDARVPREYLEDIKNTVAGSDLIPFSGPGIDTGDTVYESILCHPDIYFFMIDENVMIYAPCVPDIILTELRSRGIELIEGRGTPRGSYPDTAIYNAVRVGNCIFHNISCSDEVILNEAEKRGLKHVNVPQGYTRCSVVAVDDRSFITSDPGIAKAARALSFDVLSVTPGYILLPGEKYGFIGGASGTISGDGVLFAGDIISHPEYAEIKHFIESRGMNIYTAEGPLYDAGGFIILR